MARSTKSKGPRKVAPATAELTAEELVNEVAPEIDDETREQIDAAIAESVAEGTTPSAEEVRARIIVEEVDGPDTVDIDELDKEFAELNASITDETIADEIHELEQELAPDAPKQGRAGRRYSPDQIRAIRAAVAAGEKQSAVAKKFGCVPMMVRNIVMYNVYKDVDPHLNPRAKGALHANGQAHVTSNDASDASDGE